MRKFARTISGVTPLAVMTAPMRCPGECLYCPTYADAPRSYTPESPAVLRARTCDYDARQQVALRLRIFEEMGHPTDKIELIVMGGTFLAQPVDYQHRFIKDCYDGLNGAAAGTLEEAKKINETARHRCTGLCIETRPDWCGPEEIERMLAFGATRVELGVQTLSEDVYRLVRRGHGVREVVEATARLRESGFKVYYHWMPGLPGSTPEADLEQSKLLFADPRFRPDGLKLYPTMVVAGTGLERWYKEGRYRPYDDATMVGLTIAIKSIVPKYVRISRVLRDIPSKFIVAGLRDSLRDIVREKMKQENIQCRCIRCREYGHRAQAGREIGEPRLARLDYDAAGGREVFLSFEDDSETLFGLLRLRVQPRPVPALGGENGNTAIIRELHVFGPEVPLNEQNVAAAQHKGIGRALLREAERIARDEFQASTMVVLSGTGAREYYRTGSDYAPRGDYLVKALNPPTV
ncbi:MAG: tRNA uridine(34) 5-carboxymethylaminomethyl modification radical SAM/GNAT enzyme Elp3 [Chloroflexi bacterium RBG_16_60_22]|nr:MAG: tRNA uridine(34) 5-carboxymethylaminomethyl modification radical SAM/GNAT enzyme Elp3 [Chloroflexi bacterium RBG_16_60_22]